MRSPMDEMVGNEPGRSLVISRHAQLRQQQRGYEGDAFDLVLHYGTQVKGGVLLTDKDVERVKHEARRFVGRLEHLAGTVVIVHENVVTSVYRPRACQRRRMTRRSTPRRGRRWLENRRGTRPRSKA